MTQMKKIRQAFLHDCLESLVQDKKFTIDDVIENSVRCTGRNYRYIDDYGCYNLSGSCDDGANFSGSATEAASTSIPKKSICSDRVNLYWQMDDQSYTGIVDHLHRRDVRLLALTTGSTNF